jgi:hypothetical protein
VTIGKSINNAADFLGITFANFIQRQQGVIAGVIDRRNEFNAHA